LLGTIVASAAGASQAEQLCEHKTKDVDDEDDDDDDDEVDELDSEEVESSCELQSAVQRVPQPLLQVGDGGPDLNVVVGWLLSGGQSIENISNSLKHGGEGIFGNEGKLGICMGGIFKGAHVGSGTGDQ
jgi:hypothetical protein